MNSAQATMTTVYLIRHGIATERGTYANDDERPLTRDGVRKTQLIAKRLHQLKITFDLILSSPLIRAQQTADILKAENLAQSITLSDDLSPGGHIEQWLVWLKHWENTGGTTLAMVGHQPDLGNWAETLVWGDSKERMIVKKAGVVGIKLPSMDSPIGKSSLFWLTPPRFLL